MALTNIMHVYCKYYDISKGNHAKWIMFWMRHRYSLLGLCLATFDTTIIAFSTLHHSHFQRVPLKCRWQRKHAAQKLTEIKANNTSAFDKSNHGKSVKYHFENKRKLEHNYLSWMIWINENKHDSHKVRNEKNSAHGSFSTLNLLRH